ncbi:MAG TPA: hypothetical protein VKR06_02495 [Ktedonosporobacter sp.]|nr:hypothetical protein [Ktedonosporobacter sp.]
MKQRLVTIILVIIIIAGAGALGYTIIQSARARQQVAEPLSTVQLPVDGGIPYKATIPGPLCDHGGGQWQKGTRYVDKKTKKEFTDDQFSSLTCQSDGLLISRTGNFGYYAVAHFEGYNPVAGQNAPFPQNYRVQVDAKVVSGDDQAAVAIGVHNQETGYGAYTFSVGVNGMWEADRDNKIDGSPEKRLAIGFLKKPSKTYTLMVEVNGPVMLFKINGTQVAMVSDTTYPTTATVDFGMVDTTVTQSPSALFSNFIYTALPLSHTIATPDPLQAALNRGNIYEAPAPGFDCDKGTGQWEPSWIANVSMQCLANGLRITANTNSHYVEEENFYGQDGNFPANYKVAAQIDMNQMGDQGCAGIFTRINFGGDNDQAQGEYEFYICQQGYWIMQRYDAAGKGQDVKLASGTVAASTSYTLQAIAKGSQQSLLINGTQVASVSDTALPATDHIALVLSEPQGTSGSVVFSNFVFTPFA